MSEKYVDADYLKEMARYLQHIKEQTYHCMQIHPGQRVLDLGCGPGVDTVPLAKYVGAQGKVIGIDNDADMISKADDFARQENVAHIVAHQVADVLSLSFDSESFDSCRAERLFQVLPKSINPDDVLKEALRVIKKGGRLIVADTDWATASVDFPDISLERKLLRFFAEYVRPNGFAGRQFYRLLKQHGLGNIEYLMFPMVQTQFSQTPFGNWLIEESLAAGIASQIEVDDWRATLDARDRAGEFFMTVNMVLVAGQKP